MSRLLQRLQRRLVVALACLVLALSVAPAAALPACPKALATYVLAVSSVGVSSAAVSGAAVSSAAVAVAAQSSPQRSRRVEPAGAMLRRGLLPLDARVGASPGRQFYPSCPVYLSICRLSC